jgi:hypothetical protein
MSNTVAGSTICTVCTAGYYGIQYEPQCPNTFADLNPQIACPSGTWSLNAADCPSNVYRTMTLVPKYADVIGASVTSYTVTVNYQHGYGQSNVAIIGFYDISGSSYDIPYEIVGNGENYVTRNVNNRVKLGVKRFTSYQELNPNFGICCPFSISFFLVF